MLYDILLWDLDGTLTDPKEGITRCVQYALEKMGHPYPSTDELEFVIGPPLSHSFEILLNTKDKDVIEQALALYRERYGAKGMFENTLYPGIPDLLAALQADGCMNVLATSKPLVFADQILKHFNLDSYFKLIMGSRLNGELVDKGDLIREILRQLNISDRKRIVMIGDRRYDVKGARKNGIDVISVAYGYGSMSELQEAGPDYLVPGIDALKEFLYQNP